MNEQVAANPGTIGAIITPTKDVLRIESDFRSIAQETVPINSLCIGVGRDRVLPGSLRRAAINPRLNQIQLADSARRKKLFCFGIDNGTDALAANLKDSTGFSLRLDGFMPIGKNLHN